MPKATNLIEAYNNFVVEPLKTEEKFREFYSERPQSAPSPIEALNDAIVSTGKISEFISVMRDAAIKAYRNENKRITKKEVEKALEKLRRTYDRTLTEAHKRRLLEIHETKEARDENIDDSTIRNLLFSLTVVEYEDEEGRWCDTNPLLMPLVEKWKKT